MFTWLHLVFWKTTVSLPVMIWIWNRYPQTLVFELMIPQLVVLSCKVWSLLAMGSSWQVQDPRGGASKRLPSLHPSLKLSASWRHNGTSCLMYAKHLQLPRSSTMVNQFKLLLKTFYHWLWKVTSSLTVLHTGVLFYLELLRREEPKRWVVFCHSSPQGSLRTCRGNTSSWSSLMSSPLHLNCFVPALAHEVSLSHEEVHRKHFSLPFNSFHASLCFLLERRDSWSWKFSFIQAHCRVRKSYPPGKGKIQGCLWNLDFPSPPILMVALIITP